MDRPIENASALSLPEWDVLGSNELEAQHRNRLHTFRNALDVVVSQSVILDIHSLDHVVADPAKAINTELGTAIESRVKTHGEALWLSPEFAWLGWAGLQKFDVIRTGRAETSAHQVFFGLLHDGNGEMGKYLPIAVKPCVTNQYTAMYDWLNTTIANQYHGERSYDPIGFIMQGGVGYALTRLEREQDTLDTTNWASLFRGNEHSVQYEGQRGSLAAIAELLADFHRKKVFHGDPQLKNIAIDITGELFFIDWESATFYQDQANDQWLTHKTIHDLRVLFGSLIRREDKGGVGLLDGFSPSVQWHYFKKYFFDPYVEQFLDDLDEKSPDFQRMSKVEEDMGRYVLSGEIYDSLKRGRQN